MPSKIYNTQQVFGISTGILSTSYVDRGDLDIGLARLLSRDVHIAMRGESKCGKSWLRQKVIPNAITVQCRLKKTVKDIYSDALSQLGLSLLKERATASSWSLKLKATSTLGLAILGNLSLHPSGEYKRDSSETAIPVGRDLNDLRFVSDIINSSGRRLVIEDFHYLSPAERKAFAHDLKALWDYKTFTVIIGIWAENNLLLHLNPDLTARIEEVSIYWTAEDLGKVIDLGSSALNIEISNRVRSRLVEDSYGTVGILQKLALDLLDAHGIKSTATFKRTLDDPSKFESVAMDYAEQLNALYQTFALRVARGIRNRKNATGIYAHMLAVVLDSDGRKLSGGMSTDEIFKEAHRREPRIQKGNLRQALRHIDGIQVDEEGRGLILTFDEIKDEVSVVDKQLFFYRKYATARWPWETIIEEVNESEGAYKSEGDADA